MSVIATSSEYLKIHEWPEGDLKQCYLPRNENDGPIKTISWGRDGTWILIVPSVGQAEIVSIKDNVKLLQTVQDIYHPTCAVFQNTTKRNVTVGTSSGQVLVYDIKLRNVKKRFPRAQSAVFNLQYNSRDTHIAAACINGDVLVYNQLTTNLSSSYKVPKSDSVSAIKFHRSKRNFLAAGSEEGIIATWDINTNKVICDVQAHQGPITDITFSPIRSDLLISSGLDRRFAFYDLLANKCVIEVEVTSSTTALDFSSCGTYLGLGSQNGNVILYDTRNFAKPISAFVAHEGKKIRHLLFQKVLNSSHNSNSMQISCDNMTEQSPQVKELFRRSLGNSLGIITCDDCSDSVNKEESCTNELHLAQNADSFLAALGLDSDRSISDASLKCDSIEEAQNWPECTKSVSFHDQTAESIAAYTTSNGIKQFSSTPKYNVEDPSGIHNSPITSKKVNVHNDVQVDEHKQVVTNIVKEEIKNQFDTMKEEMRLEFLEASSHMRQQFLDLHMAIIKQFVGIESKIDKINNGTVREFICDDFLIKKNNELLREVESLREQVVEKVCRKF